MLALAADMSEHGPCANGGKSHADEHTESHVVASMGNEPVA